MPASASIHFCFHYASFLRSFQINFNASLNFEVYKKTLVLPTLVNWDPFRNPEDAFALVQGGNRFPCRHSAGSRCYQSENIRTPGQKMELCFRCQTPAPRCAGSGNPSRAVLSLTPTSPCSADLSELGLVHKRPAKAGGGEHCG